jgi:hypothetical protein
MFLGREGITHKGFCPPAQFTGAQPGIPSLTTHAPLFFPLIDFSFSAQGFCDCTQSYTRVVFYSDTSIPRTFS